MILAKPNYPNVETLHFRHMAKKAIRSLFDDQGFIELDTPYLLTANTPDPFIDPIFVTAAVGKFSGQLHTSPEIWLKRGLSLGFTKLYHMARVFRDDPPGDHHSREFTMLEWYRTDAQLDDLIYDCQQIFQISQNLALKLGLLPNCADLSIQKIDVDTLFKDLADIDLPHVQSRITAGDHDYLQTLLSHKKNEYLPKDASFSDAFFHVMLKYIEPNLPKQIPIAIYRWPIQLAALSAPCVDDPSYCDRFEIYFQGLEIANAYQECCDSIILRALSLIHI